jgi:hypothetical protein
MTFFFWNFIENNEYVSRIVNAGNLTFRGNEFEIMNFYMTNTAPYLFYAIVTGVLGWILIKLKHRKVTEIHETSVINRRDDNYREYGEEKTPSVISETVITRTEKE